MLESQPGFLHPAKTAIYATGLESQQLDCPRQDEHIYTDPAMVPISFVSLGCCHAGRPPLPGHLMMSATALQQTFKVWQPQRAARSKRPKTRVTLSPVVPRPCNCFHLQYTLPHGTQRSKVKSPSPVKSRYSSAPAGHGPTKPRATRL